MTIPLKELRETRELQNFWAYKNGTEKKALKMIKELKLNSYLSLASCFIFDRCFEFTVVYSVKDSGI